MPHLLFSSILLVSFYTPWSEVAKTNCSPSTRRGYANDWPNGLDFGLYWMGPDQTFEKAGLGGSALYDPAKSTVIYFHGWEGAFGGSTKVCFRVDTSCEPCFHRMDIMDGWYHDWNVGYFFWDQFADERCLRDAELKIWPHEEQPLRWLSNDCQGPDFVGKMEYHSYDGMEDSVGALCAQNVREVMSGFNGPEIRFVGESLGAQLAAKCAELVIVGGIVSTPARVILLEPAFSHYGFAGLLQCKQVANSSDFGKIALQRTNQALEKLKSWNVTRELYTTATGFLEWAICASPELRHDYHVRYHPRWCNTPPRFFQFNSYQVAGCYHNAVVSLYFLSMGAPPLPLAGRLEGISSKCRVPSASSNFSEIRQLRHNCGFGQGPLHFEHSEGIDTIVTDDDTFSVSINGTATPLASKAAFLAQLLPSSWAKESPQWFTSSAVLGSFLVGMLFLFAFAARRAYNQVDVSYNPMMTEEALYRPGVRLE